MLECDGDGCEEVGDGTDCITAVVGQTALTGEATGAAEATAGGTAAAVETHGGGLDPHSGPYSFLTCLVKFANSEAQRGASIRDTSTFCAPSG